MLEKLAKQTAVYGISTIVVRFLSYLLTPYYTRVFGQETYGVVTDIYALIPLALTLLTMGMESSYFRFSAKAEEAGGDVKAAKRRISGVAELSLVVGVATWKGNALPVLLYPVSVTIEDDGLSTTIRFTGRVALNVAFVNTLREQGVFLDEDSLFDGASYDSGTPETSAMFARISSEASERISDFAIERQIVLGLSLIHI